jgi:signal transduction histidine kinase
VIGHAWEVVMSGGASGFRRVAGRSLLACGRGLILAMVSLAGILLFTVSLVSVLCVAAGIGVLLAPGSLLAVRRLASSQRRRSLDWSGVSIATPYRPRPDPASGGLAGRLRYCKWLLDDPATWRDMGWMLVSVPAGWLLGLMPLFVFSLGLWALAADIGTVLFGWWNSAPPTAGYQVIFLSMLPLGLLGLTMSPRLLKAHARVASLLLAPARDELAARVARLAESRSQVVDASAAELRRIERDLHDGAQARMVSAGMSIGLAERAVRDDPELALSLLAEARASNGRALSEMRALVRGIHPPVLAERGLDGAVQALALTLPLPVEVHISLSGRAAAPVESAVYFAIAEALANVIKHSAANRAWVHLEYDNGTLIAIVGDDGAGGAILRPGGGLHGIEQRLAAFDGVVALTSPPGGPTLVTMEVACELSSART